MSTSMRAKLTISAVDKDRVDGHEPSDSLTFHAVCPSGNYPDDGSDENNTYAKFTPNANLQMTVANPALLDKFAIGDTFLVDFTPVS